MSTPKDIINEIYQNLCNEEEKYKKGVSPVDYEGLKRILRRLNSGIRFLIELIQNADDNEYNNSKPWVKFTIFYDKNDSSYYLLLTNNEKGFKKENITKLCKFFGSTKRALGFIGEFGAGFKSVFSISDNPQIYSNGFNLMFKYNRKNSFSLIKPYWVETPPKFIDHQYTNILLPFKEKDKEKILLELEKIKPQILLFLRNIKILEIEDKVNNQKTSLEKIVEKDIISIKFKNNKRRHFLIVKKSFKISDQLKEYLKKDIEKSINVDNTEIILAFPLKNDGHLITKTKQTLFAFLPVKEYNFNFIIQADFLLNTSREDISKNNDWNKWLRDKIIDVFLLAINKFKNNKKYNYNFYDYIPIDIEDPFFKELENTLLGKLKKKQIILTSLNQWRKPSEVFFGSKQIREIIDSNDLYQLLGKFFLADNIKNKNILRKLGVEDFGIENLISMLKYEEWVKKQSYEWFIHLYNYFADSLKTDENEDLLNKLKQLKIIKLENESIISLKEENAIFFNLAQNNIYGFEKEIPILHREISKLINNIDANSTKKIKDFLEKLGIIINTNPEQIIKKYILTIFKTDEWKDKTNLLIGYIRYIKDNFKKLRDNTDLIEEIRDNIYLMSSSGEKDFKKPNELFLPKFYNNTYALEELFEGFDVPFVHKIYLDEDIYDINLKINRLSNLKSNNKKSNKDIEKLEKQKNTKINKWKEFFLEIGVNEGFKIEETEESYLLWEDKYQLRINNSFSSSYTAEEITNYKLLYLEDILNILESNHNKDFLLKVISLLEHQWDELLKFKEQLYGWRYRSWYYSKTDADWLHLLKTKKWLLTTENTLECPCNLFLNKPDIKKVLGESVSYLGIQIKNEDFLNALGISKEYKTKHILDALEYLVKNKCNKKERFLNLYKLLNDRSNNKMDIDEIKERFKEQSLIFIPKSKNKYYSSTEVIWKEDKILGQYKPHIKAIYPDLKRFFVNKIEINIRPILKDYLDYLYFITTKSNFNEEDREIIIKIYERLNSIIEKETEDEKNNKEGWDKFIQKPIFLTEKGCFHNRENLFIKDNQKLYNLFKDEKEIYFLWLPDNYNPKMIDKLIKSIKICYFSEEMKSNTCSLQNEVYDEELTNFIKKIIPYCIRYLYRRDKSTYQKMIKEERLFINLNNIKVYKTEDLSVKYSLEINQTKIEKEHKEPYFFENNKLYVNKKNNITKFNNLILEIFKDNTTQIDFFIEKVIDMLDNPNLEEFLEEKGIKELPNSELDFLNQDVFLNEEEDEEEEDEEEEDEEEEDEEEEDEEEEDEEEEDEEEEDEEEEDEEEEDKEEEDEEEEDEEEEDEEEEDEEEEDGEEEEEEEGEGAAEAEAFLRILDMAKEETLNNYKINNKIIEYEINSQEQWKTEVIESVSQKERKKIGYYGELYTFLWLGDKYKEKYPNSDAKIKGNKLLIKVGSKTYVTIKWLNKNREQKKPYDLIIDENKNKKYIEVKSTKKSDKNTFRISKNQFDIMRKKKSKFYIYRVYNVGDKKIRIKILENPIEQLSKGTIEIYKITFKIN
ncbi:MAG: DUF3883 domain-containing protein [Promethearchaeota archaeon]